MPGSCWRLSRPSWTHFCCLHLVHMAIISTISRCTRTSRTWHSCKHKSELVIEPVAATDTNFARRLTCLTILNPCLDLAPAESTPDGFKPFSQQGQLLAAQTTALARELATQAQTPLVSDYVTATMGELERRLSESIARVDQLELEHVQLQVRRIRPAPLITL